jgi:S1-C subfamily serine protease
MAGQAKGARLVFVAPLKSDRRSDVNHDRARAVYDRYASGVAWVETCSSEGSIGIGTAFQVGEEVWATAAHVVENPVQRVGTSVPSREVFRTELGARRVEQTHESGTTAVTEGPFFHPDPYTDLALFRVADLDAEILPLIDEDDSAGEPLTLKPVLVLGYPRVPGAIDPPPLLATMTTISATANLYFGGEGPQVMILDAMARPGFSGGPVVGSEGQVLGLITRSLVPDHNETERGFLSAVRSAAIAECADAHGLDVSSPASL